MRTLFPGIKKIISTKDIVAKVICILLSVILWAYLSSINIGEVKFKIPLTFTNLPETLIMSQVSNRYVSVTLTGKKDNIKNVNVKSIKAVVNLEQADIGINRDYPIELVKDEVPENIDIALSVKELNLVIERKIYKRTKVKANIVDKVMSGYILDKIVVVPDSITINGPESLVRNIDFVETNKISIANINGKLIKDISIDNKNMPGISMDISKVKVTIPIIEKANLSEFKKKIILKNISDRYDYFLGQEDVSVYLKSDNINITPSADDVDVFVDLGLDLDEFFKEGNKNYIEKNYPIDTVSKKEGVRVISISPDIISIKILEK